MVPTLIRDGNVGTAHNSCQIDINCQLLQAWDYLAKCARTAQLNRSRRKSKKYPEVPEWPAFVGNNQSGEFDHLSPEWSALPVLVSRIQYTQAGNV